MYSIFSTLSLRMIKERAQFATFRQFSQFSQFSAIFSRFSHLTHFVWKGRESLDSEQKAFTEKCFPYKFNMLWSAQKLRMKRMIKSTFQSS